MRLQVFHHSESPEPLRAENSVQAFVADDKALIFRIVQVFLFDYTPDTFDHLVSRHRLLAQQPG